MIRTTAMMATTRQQKNQQHKNYMKANKYEK